jgi:hypothetical protein
VLALEVLPPLNAWSNLANTARSIPVKVRIDACDGVPVTGGAFWLFFDGAPGVSTSVATSGNLMNDNGPPGRYMFVLSLPRTGVAAGSHAIQISPNTDGSGAFEIPLSVR